MSDYTTGELAKLCNVSVRTVQFYDSKELLIPTELTEGGRRLYSQADLERLNLICLLKSLGLSLNSIKEILESKNPEKILLILLGEQTKKVNSEMDILQKRLREIEVVRDSIDKTKQLSVKSRKDIDKTMEGRKKLKRARILTLVFGILFDIIEVVTIILWIMTGIWWPFAIGMCIVLFGVTVLVKMMLNTTAYICPECGEKFKPSGRDVFFARHTATTRKLTCTKCGCKGWCIETFSDNESEERQ